MSADEEESRLVIDVDDPSIAEAEEMQVDVVNVSIQDENSNRGVDAFANGFSNKSEAQTTEDDAQSNMENMLNINNEEIHDEVLDGHALPKKMVDKSTCVFPKTLDHQYDDETLFNLKCGTNLTIGITIVCKAGGNTIYILAKWKDKEYHGVLTDGEPLHSHMHLQQRNTFTAVPDKIDEPEAEKIQGNEKPPVEKGKPRKRMKNLMAISNERKRLTIETNPDLNENGELSGETVVEISTLSAYLSEYEPPEKYNKQCLHPDCGFKFETTNELNAHMFTVHKSGFKALITESISTQTDEFYSIQFNPNLQDPANKSGGYQIRTGKESICSRCKQKIIDEEGATCSINLSNKSSDVTEVKQSKTSRSPNSLDISEDVAPVLEKEEGFDKLTGAENLTKKQGSDIVKQELDASQNERFAVPVSEISRSPTYSSAPTRKMGYGDFESSLKKISPVHHTTNTITEKSLSKERTTTSHTTAPCTSTIIGVSTKTLNSPPITSVASTSTAKHPPFPLAMDQPLPPTTSLPLPFSLGNGTNLQHLSSLINSAQFASPVEQPNINLQALAALNSPGIGQLLQPSARFNGGRGQLSVGTVCPPIPTNLMVQPNMLSNFLTQPNIQQQQQSDANRRRLLSPGQRFPANDQQQQSAVQHKIYELQQRSGASSPTIGNSAVGGRVSATGRSSLSPNVRPQSVIPTNQRSVNQISAQYPIPSNLSPNSSAVAQAQLFPFQGLLTNPSLLPGQSPMVSPSPSLHQLRQIMALTGTANLPVEFASALFNAANPTSNLMAPQLPPTSGTNPHPKQ